MNKLTRRNFAQVSLGSVAAEALAPQAGRGQTAKRMIGIQVGAVSFVDEGVEQVLDNFQKLGSINTLFVATFTYGRGIAGRQVPGQPLPDHGKQEYDQETFHGGNYAMPHAHFYEKTSFKPAHAPDHGEFDLLEQVLPKARQRGMKGYCW